MIPSSKGQCGGVGILSKHHRYLRYRLRALGDADSESLSPKQVGVLERLSQIVSYFLDVLFVLRTPHDLGILCSQGAQQGSEFAPQHWAAWVRVSLWIAVHVCPLKGPINRSGNQFRLNEK